MRRYLNQLKTLSVAVFALSLVACAHTGPDANPDPLEPFNRAMFKVNDKLDRAIIKPVAKGYVKVIPAPVRKRVGNFFRNLGEPTTIINDILQGKLPQAGNDLGRFAINSTIGLLGLFDVASKIGLEYHQEDFGQTFSKWGMDRGPYLVLPFLGPSTVLDGIGRIPQTLYTNPQSHVEDSEVVIGLIATEAVDTRARLLSTTKVLDIQLDPYIFAREAYLQRRLNLIYDGDPPIEEDDWQ